MRVHGSPAGSLRAAALVVLAAGLGACGDDSTGPVTEFDAARAADALENVLSAADGNDDVYASLELVGQTLSANQATSAALLPGGAEVMSLLPSPGAVRTLDPAATMFPANLLGKTLVYDVETGGYVVGEAAAGAPENGVRFIYYAIDPVTQRPAEPLNPLGHLDLTDESSPSSMRLGVEVVATPVGAAPVTLIDYFIDVAYTAGSGAAEVTVVAEGYLTDGEERLDFDLSQTLSVAEGDGFDVAVDHRLELVEQDVSVALTADSHWQAGEQGGVVSSYSLELTHGSENVVMELTQENVAQVDGTVAYNGATVIVIDGVVGQLGFTRPDGSEIGQAEVQALLALRDGIELVTEFAEKIFAVFDTGA